MADTSRETPRRRREPAQSKSPPKTPHRSRHRTKPRATRVIEHGPDYHHERVYVDIEACYEHTGPACRVRPHRTSHPDHHEAYMLSFMRNSKRFKVADLHVRSHRIQARAMTLHVNFKPPRSRFLQVPREGRIQREGTRQTVKSEFVGRERTARSMLSPTHALHHRLTALRSRGTAVRASERPLSLKHHKARH
ncbi:hypothetical protein K466DRAFT_592788 [Polyporus arcularius HHB13444]|uniref:Uncharacterized protein n=1 Tax=Polyporus arcularius HHB13444 TaxID=1314778 RepID=A0A5C3NPG1_9APHY|nr:hypothetical protein K466DRAFT_592788 [Polyporus arcularius HHB13444]